MRFEGVTAHGNMYFDVPFISEIVPGLWQGGCQNGLKLPYLITDVVSLYRWERYDIIALHSFTEITMYDTEAGTPDRDEVFALADWVNLRRKAGGQVLVHCQAGLNRSSLVAATALVRNGDFTPEEAVAHMRETRSPACLCNRKFEEFVLELEIPV
jgi:protein-tyrosine phosphatase